MPITRISNPGKNIAATGSDVEAAGCWAGCWVEGCWAGCWAEAAVQGSDYTSQNSESRLPAAAE